jgi:hypothetical protein
MFSQLQLGALYDLYQATNGVAWIYPVDDNNVHNQPWNFTSKPWEDINPCIDQWSGVLCNCDDFESNKFNLKEASECNTTLKVLDLCEHNLVGTIPNSISYLSTLESLALENNHLTNTIPSSISNLTNLIDLNLRSNYFVGTIPGSIGNLTSLESLVLRRNELNGSIPQSLYQLKHLKYVDLRINYLFSDISSDIQYLQSTLF